MPTLQCFYYYLGCDHYTTAEKTIDDPWASVSNPNHANIISVLGQCKACRREEAWMKHPRYAEFVSPPSSLSGPGSSESEVEVCTLDINMGRSSSSAAAAAAASGSSARSVASVAARVPGRRKMPASSGTATSRLQQNCSISSRRSPFSDSSYVIVSPPHSMNDRKQNQTEPQSQGTSEEEDVEMTDWTGVSSSTDLSNSTDPSSYSEASDSDYQPSSSSYLSSSSSSSHRRQDTIAQTIREIRALRGTNSIETKSRMPPLRRLPLDSEWVESPGIPFLFSTQPLPSASASSTAAAAAASRPQRLRLTLGNSNSKSRRQILFPRFSSSNPSAHDCCKRNVARFLRSLVQEFEPGLFPEEEEEEGEGEEERRRNRPGDPTNGMDIFDEIDFYDRKLKGYVAMLRERTRLGRSS